MNTSTVLVMVDRVEMRDSVASDFQFSIALAEDTLVPFSNARRRALSKHQHRRAHTKTLIYEGWQLTLDIDPTHRSRGSPRP